MTQHLSRRAFLALSGGVAASAALPACTTQSSSSSSSGAAPLTFWSGYSTSDPNDKNKKPEDFWIYQSSQRYTDATGIPVEIEALPEDATMFTKIRTAAIAGEGPDVASVWSGTYMLSIKDALEPMAQYFSDAEISEISGWAAVTDGFDPSVKDKILGVPNGSDGAQTLLGSSETLAQFDIDPGAWPVSYDEWVGQLDTIKSGGVTPLSLGQAGFIFYLFDTWLAQIVGGSVGIGGLASGERNFSDPEIADVTEKWLALRDYAIPGAATTPDDQALQPIYTGEAAMTVGGAGAVPSMRGELGDGLFVGKLPDISPSGITGGTIGGTGVAFLVSKTSEQKQAAADYIKHLLSLDEQQLLADSGEPAPLVGRTDMSDSYDDSALNELQAWGVEESNTFWPDNTLPAELVDELASQSQLVWSGEIDGAEFLSRLDQKRDSLL